MVAPQKYLLAVLSSLALVSASDDTELLKRQSALLNGVHGSVMNSRQQIDKLNAEIRAHPEHAGAMIATTFAQATDSQIDNAINTVAEALAPLTGGLSVAVGRAILGPFVQSITDGAEVLIGNVIGGTIDLVRNPQMIMNLSRSYSNLIAQAGRYNINTSRLQSIQKQLQNHLPKH
ncbi:hypothetical protein TRICI_001399 [Trichomonascus ciferrii]|uniref:Uncharacterized protein n=1 Tax=Trichomonascus ciferrii TaxID=44093 RepID=A0A642VB42_9ASCO|nr:hypothetical protein TRICI_001399 [Trichomonascus ciferrii]